MGAGSVLFGFLAGVLSVLSPCVLPVLPLVAGAAAAAHRAGPALLAAGLAVSFTAAGLLVATVGFAAGLDDGVFRTAAAAVLGLMGAVLLSGALQRRFALATGRVGNAGHRLLARLSPLGHTLGLGGQFVVGLVLGAAWSPCVGPTLGAASALAAQGQDIGAVATVMLAFGVGAALPLLALGTLSRQAMLRWRGRMAGAGAGRAGKLALGAAALAVAGLILTGLDHKVEAALVVLSPAWLTALTTRF